MGLKENLRESMQAENISSVQLAEHVGVSSAAVSKWLKTGLISRDNLKLAARMLNTTPDYLDPAIVVDGNFPTAILVTHSELSELNPDIYAAIPLLDALPSAGNGDVAPCDAQAKQHMVFSNNWMMSKHYIVNDMRIMVVRGESMRPALNDGDTVLIDTLSRHIVDGKVYALLFGREIRLKRLKLRHDGSIVIMSDNPAPEYADEVVSTSNHETLHIIGRAVHQSGDI